MRYLGSHARLVGERQELDLVVTPREVHILSNRNEVLYRIDGSALKNVEVDDRESIEERLTAGRILVLGVFALLAKKTRIFSYLTIEDNEGLWVFEVPDVKAVELAAISRRVQQELHSSSSKNLAEVSKVADRLATLSELWEQGLISEAEYVARRQSILDEI